MKNRMSLEYDNISLPPKDGWAPGAYMNNCRLCGETYVGDKLSWQCSKCVYPDNAEKRKILNAIEHSLDNLMLPVGAIEKAIKDGIITKEEMIALVDRYLEV
jgi:hypothetical protein